VCHFFLVYYLKATLGSYTADAVLEIPISVTSGNKYLTVYYLISSSKIELVVRQREADKTEDKAVVKYTDQYSFDGWNSYYFLLDSDVEAIQLVASKIGVTTNVEYVLVDSVEITLAQDMGNMPLLHCRPTVLFIENVLFKHDAIAKRATYMH